MRPPLFSGMLNQTAIVQWRLSATAAEVCNRAPQDLSASDDSAARATGSGRELFAERCRRLRDGGPPEGSFEHVGSDM